MSRGHLPDLGKFAFDLLGLLVDLVFKVGVLFYKVVDELAKSDFEVGVLLGLF